MYWAELTNSRRSMWSPRLLIEAAREANYLLAVNSGFFFHARERYLRAEILSSLGRHDEALRWYGSFAEHSRHGLPYLAPSHLRRGEIYERLGEPEEAALHYRRVVQLWRDCDPELRPMYDYAERRLAHLTGERADD